MSNKKQSMKSFRETEEILNAFLDHFPGAVFIRDSHSRYLHVNKYFKDVFGTKKRWMVEEDEKALKDGYNIYEREVKLTDDRISNFEIHSFRIDREGEEPLIGGIAIDITDWYNSKQALRESEERYRAVFQTTCTATIIVDCDKTILLANKGFERLSGYKGDEICGKKKWTEFVDQQDLNRMIRFYEARRAEKSSIPNEYEFNFIDREGNLKSVHLQVDMILGTKRSVCSLLDISELKSAQEELRRSIKNRESFLRAIPDMMFVLSRDGEYVDYRVENDDELAIPAEKIIGSNISELDLDEEKLQEIMDCINNSLKTGEVQSVEYKLDFQSERRFYEARLSPYGEELVIALVREITDRRKAENERLELEAKIQHTQKLESLGVLAGGIAHDFNNILMAILGNADLALTTVPKTSFARSSLNEIVNAATTAADLARQMLAYSGRSKYEILPLDLNRIVVELTHMLEVSISKKAILKFRLADKLPLIMADAAQIRQILMNLITNASEAIGDASGVISITTGAMYCDAAYMNKTELTSEKIENMYVYIEVSDTGCGMDESVKSQLFEPFFTTKFSGRGLGLSSVLGIIRSHNGAIKVYSEPGEGTTFKILFPVCDNDFTDSLDPDEGITKEEWVGKGTVLFADDEDTVLAVGRRMLQHLGFNVLQARDGREAVDLFRKNAEDLILVILDLTMPHLSGDEVYREIRKISTDIPVIVSSGFSREDVMHRFAGKHLAGYIQKPYRIGDLSAIIREVLEKQNDKLSE